MIKIFKVIFNILIAFIVILFLNHYSFATTVKTVEIKQEKPKTIKQLKENIEVLRSKKVINFSIFEKFKIEHWELQNYFSKNLTSENFSEIEKIISNYKKQKEIIKSSSDNKIQKLVNLEKEFYNSLLVHIDKDKITLYNTFVEKKIATIKKEDEIKLEIKDNKKQIEKKVSIIKDRIEENNKVQEEKINSLIKIRVKAQIDKFKNSDHFSKLPEDKQELIFKLILQKIQNRKEKSINLSEKTLKLYSIIEEVLLEIIWEYKKA